MSTAYLPATVLQLVSHGSHVQTVDDELVRLDIGVLDALVLLSSRRVPVGVEAWTSDATSTARVTVDDAGDGVGAGDWDRALRRLLEG